MDSVLAQTYQNWECIVVDDGSNDNTDVVMASYLVKDSRFQYHNRREDRVKGAPTCRNIGLDNSKGIYVIFFDSDDILPHTALECKVQYASKFPEKDFWVFQTVRFFDSFEDENFDCIWNDLNKPNFNDLYDFLCLNPVWSVSGPLWNKDFLLNKRLSFTEGINSWQDWEFHIRILLETANYIKIEDSNTRVYQRFHKGETINKAESLAISLNRIELFFKLISCFKEHRKYGRREQEYFFKLFYFLLRQKCFDKQDTQIWKKLKKELSLIPNKDLFFWRFYLIVNRKKETFVIRFIFTFLKKIKKYYFNKRIKIDNMGKRTWYKIKVD